MTEATQLEGFLTKNLREVITLNNLLEQKEQEKQDLFKEMALGIIEALDSFTRIENGLIEKEIEKTEIGEQVMKRYSTVSKKLLGFLQKNGISKLEFPDNKIIIGYSKVVDTEPDAHRGNDEIISVVKTGYIRGKELIREAEVIVVKN